MGNPKDHIYTWKDTDELVPSVTTVIHDILAAPELTEWRVVQGIIAARQNPGLDIEDIQVLTNAQRSLKASVGGAAHACAHAFHLGQEMPDEYYLPEVQGLTDIYVEWARQSYVGQVMDPEEIVYGQYDDLRYAGRPDVSYVVLGAGTTGVWLDGTRKLRQDASALIDLKFSKNNRPEWQIQLTGYWLAASQYLHVSADMLVSVRVDEEGVHAKEWDFRPKEWESILSLWYWRYGQQELDKRMMA